ncbi:MAG: tol-pal system protein YbgF [Rhodanobacter sp.]|jgi:tol-pal system protein YbgF|nr:tol-pal system protein YbgF [Rhodanobacter sp.]
MLGEEPSRRDRLHREVIVSHPLSTVLVAVALAAAAVAFAPPACAQDQRLSLAERVDRLERQTAQDNGGGGTGLVNQLSELQSQVQTLQGQVEELKHALDEANRRNKDKYVDLDSRIGRLESGTAAARPPATNTTPAAAQPPDGDSSSPADKSPPSSSPPPPPPPPSSPPPPPPPPPPRSGNADGLTDADRAAMPDAGGTAPPPTASADPAAENGTYNEALAALKDGRYAEAARRFQTFTDQYPNSTLIGNAYYWLGESYYATQNYEIAQQSFRALLQRYPNSQKVPDALLKIGYSQYELKQWDQAEATLNKVIQTYPDTSAARLAQGRLRALKQEPRP